MVDFNVKEYITYFQDCKDVFIVRLEWLVIELLRRPCTLGQARSAYISACVPRFKPAPCRFLSVYHTNKKAHHKGELFYWCARPESNRHGLAANRF